MSDLDLSDLAKELNDLRKRKDECSTCGKPTAMTSDAPVLTHVMADGEIDVNADENHDPCGLDEDDQERLENLETLESDLNSDLETAADDESTLINKDNWIDYCQELAESRGYLGNLKHNPLYHHIDWESWAKSCEEDHEEIEFDGVTYMRRRS